MAKKLIKTKTTEHFLSFERKNIFNILSTRKWFKNTDPKLKSELLSLPQDWDGFLMDLANRKDEIGGLEVLKLIDIKRGDFMAMPRFRVRVIETNEVINYREYINYKYGSRLGYSGIILLEDAGQIKYFLIKKSEKFPVAESVYDTFGEMIQYKQGQLVNLAKNSEKMIKRQLGTDELIIKRFIDLGEIYIDAGKCNMKGSLFAAIIDITKNSGQIRNLINTEIKNTKRVKFNILIEPIERMNEYIHKVENPFFLTCILRLISIGVIKIWL